MREPAARSGQPRSDQTRVLYVLGRGRGGSTIVAQTLGAPDGSFFAGEVRMLWDPVLVRGTPCACGAPVPECPVWGEVLARLTHVDREEAARCQREVVAEARVPRLLRQGAAARWPALHRYRRIMAQLYAAIVEVTGCGTVVDSSKRPSYALVVRDLPGIDPYFLHLLRDPRASAHSWRTREYAGAGGTAVRRRSAVDATLRWDLLNLGAEAVLRSVPKQRHAQLSYERFAAAPRTTADAVTTLVGGPSAAGAFADERTVHLPASHALAGNPARERIGAVTIREDGQWWRDQRPRERWLATAVALPLLRRYRYPLRPTRGS